MPVFVGRRFQRGHGLGSILSGLFRRIVLPFFKQHGKTMATSALQTGMEVADDVLGSGQSLKESTKKRIPEGIKRTVQSVIRQSVPDVKKRRHVAASKQRRRKKIVRHDDIFA